MTDEEILAAVTRPSKFSSDEQARQRDEAAGLLLFRFVKAAENIAANLDELVRGDGIITTRSA